MSDALTVTAELAPSVNLVVPASGVTSGGMIAQVYGANFVDRPGLLSCSFGGKVALGTFISSTHTTRRRLLIYRRSDASTTQVRVRVSTDGVGFGDTGRPSGTSNQSF